jgi:hypothetical protein
MRTDPLFIICARFVLDALSLSSQISLKAIFASITPIVAGGD